MELLVASSSSSSLYRPYGGTSGTPVAGMRHSSSILQVNTLNDVLPGSNIVDGYCSTEQSRPRTHTYRCYCRPGMIL